MNSHAAAHSFLKILVFNISFSIQLKFGALLYNFLMALFLWKLPLSNDMTSEMFSR